jgi:hypothetical protein
MKLTDLVDIPKLINVGVSNAKQMTMKTLLGNPRESYTGECQPITNKKFEKLLVTEPVGPFTASGLRPAIESLREVMIDIQQEQPDVYAVIGTAGMLCARLERGSEHSISYHAWGTAIDLTIDKHLNVRGSKQVLFGLVKIFPIFNRHGWYWGAGFPTEDAMHFEVGEEKIRTWNNAANIDGESKPEPDHTLSLGDRGPEVLVLQNKLNDHGHKINVDGVFGKATEQVVKDFQTQQRLQSDGVVGPNTRVALGF